MTKTTVSYNTIVTGDLTGTRGPLGLIVHDFEASRLVAISAATVVDGACRIAATGHLVGTTAAIRPERYLRARLRPAASLLTTVLINEDVAISDGRIRIRKDRLFPTLNRDAAKVIGKSVLVHLPYREPVEALVVSTSAKFAMRAPDGDGRAYFEHALELFLAGGEERARRGDAGALVTADRGEVVGLVVSARGSSTFAAPVAPLLRELRACVPLDADIIERHNLLTEHNRGTNDVASIGGVDHMEDADMLFLKAEEAGAAWDEALRSGKKAALLRAAELIDESCFA